MALFEFGTGFMPNFALLLVFKFVTGGLAGGVVANRNAMVANINYEKGA